MSDQRDQAPDENDGRPEPDVRFSLIVPENVSGQGAARAERRTTAPDSVDPRELAERVGQALAELGPPGWERFEAAVAVTVTDAAGTAAYTDGERAVRFDIPPSIVELARAQRQSVIRAGDEPWWRMLIRADAPRDGGSTPEFDIEFDHGEQPFPEGQLLAPDAYRADVAAYPRERLPVWLAAYTRHAGRQSRTPRRAAMQAAVDRAAKVWAVLAENEFPPFPQMWARWASLAAVFVAVGSEWGPRVLPAGGVFESSKRSGSTLYVLPGGRAVLSGGVWNAPALEAAYLDDAPLPNVYAGAPDWVTDLVLNARASTGLLSFCYWWEGGRWYRGESPPARDCAAAVPGVWTARTVTGIITSLVAGTGDSHRAEIAAEALVSAAETGAVARETLASLVGDGADIDIDAAMYQFSLAGLAAAVVEPMDEEEVKERVCQYIRGRGFDTAGYPLSELVAERFSCGWMVFAPLPQGEIAIGRALFYVGDDGVFEHSTSSIAPSRYIADFEQRFRQRHAAANAGGR